MRPPGRALGVLTIFSLFALANSDIAQSSDDFFAGKPITLVLSTGPGGGYDLYAQAVASHLGRHLPGRPSVVVQHMPGAAGLRATNFLYNAAPKDGTTIGLVFGPMTTANIFLPDEARFDPAQFNWIGNLEGEPAFCVSWHEAEVKSFQNLKTHELIVGSHGAGGYAEINPRIANALAGTRIRVVSGYENAAAVVLAMERGEVEGRCDWPITSIKATRPDWLPQKTINLLVQFGLEKHPDFPDVPLIMDLVDDTDDRAAVELILAARQVLRPVLAPPGVPSDRVAALRKAFDATMEDPEFLSDTAARKISVSPTPGVEVQEMIERFHGAPDAVKERARSLATGD